ncbi:MAG TPA: aldo/keto reductase [Micromonosporaceae bacterium]|nr:aldo/keto reductase [Micromonosporaceae bacterium]
MTDRPTSPRAELLTRLRQGPIGYGTAPLAGLFTPVGEAEAAAALQAGWDAGVRYFDTAPYYGAGVAERRLGAFLRSRPRSEYVVSTKVGRVLVPDEPQPGGPQPEGSPFVEKSELVSQRDYSRDGVLRSIEDSAARTGLDHFDLVLIHDAEEYWEPAITQAYPTLVELRDEGVIGAIGAGLNEAGMMARFLRETDMDAVLMAGCYTLLDRTAADEVLPLCQERGVGLIIGGVFNSGILADPVDGARYHYEPAPADLLRRARTMQAVCAEYGVPLAAAAIQFPRRHPAVTTVLAGARSAQEITDDAALAGIAIPDELWDRLEAL